MGEFGNGADRVKSLTEANYDYAQVQDLVNKVMCGETVNFEQLSDAQLENLGYTRQQVEAYKKLKEEAEKTGTPMAPSRMDLPAPVSPVMTEKPPSKVISRRSISA